MFILFPYIRILANRELVRPHIANIMKLIDVIVPLERISDRALLCVGHILTYVSRYKPCFITEMIWYW